VTKVNLQADLAELRRALRGVEGGLQDLKATHKKAAEVVAVDAVPRARRKTGAMAKSIRAAGQAKRGVVRAGFARMPYVPVQYYGWPKRNITPNPFLEDAASARLNDIYEVYEDGIDKVTKKHGLT